LVSSLELILIGYDAWVGYFVSLIENNNYRDRAIETRNDATRGSPCEPASRQILRRGLEAIALFSIKK
jgi:hypothetical protein